MSTNLPEPCSSRRPLSPHPATPGLAFQTPRQQRSSPDMYRLGLDHVIRSQSKIRDARKLYIYAEYLGIGTRKDSLSFLATCTLLNDFVISIFGSTYFRWNKQYMDIISKIDSNKWL
jgi:hypothetical protein